MLLIEVNLSVYIPDAACISSVAAQMSVTTCGHRMHAAFPSWCHQRHSPRIGQAGRTSTTAGSISTVRRTRRQSFPSKCWHLPAAHGAAIRNTSDGFSPCGNASTSREIDLVFCRYPTLGSSTVPPTTPKMTLLSISAWALGHRSSFLESVDISSLSAVWLLRCPTVVALSGSRSPVRDSPEAPVRPSRGTR